MKVLLAAPHIYMPQLYGGVQTSMDQLCRALIGKGHSVAALVGVKRGGLFGYQSLLKMKLNALFFKHKVARDTILGYPVWRTWFPADMVEYVVGKEKPDLIVIMTGKIVPIALAAKLTQIPILVHLHDVAFHAHGGDFKDLGHIPCVANSRFTADKYREAFGIEATVIHPFISAEQYRTDTTRENVTFINPIPVKGCDIALEIARHCPDIPFTFVEGLPLSVTHGQEVIRKIYALRNVTLLPSQQDMRNVYGKCKILLTPSICDEAYGRVVTEAQINGIPVIASARGGLPEAVGTGGILLNPDDPIEHWVNAVRKLWKDDALYAALSTAALVHAQRPEMNFSYQIDAHEKAMLAACSAQNKNNK